MWIAATGQPNGYGTAVLLAMEKDRQRLGKWNVPLLLHFFRVAFDAVAVHVARGIQMLLLVLAGKLGFAYFA